MSCDEDEEELFGEFESLGDGEEATPDMLKRERELTIGRRIDAPRRFREYPIRTLDDKYVLNSGEKPNRCINYNYCRQRDTSGVPVHM